MTYTPEQKAMLAKKDALANELQAVRAGKVSNATFQQDAQAFLQQYGMQPSGETPLSIICTNGCGSGPSYISLYMPQQPQKYYSWCGPATVSEALTTLGKPQSQSTVAAYMGTNGDGTPWGYPYPMAGALNHYTNTSFYAEVTAGTLTSYVNDLTTDISIGYPVVDAVQEEANTTTPHLVGHPTNIVIDHWVAANGFSNYGSDTQYDDSVHGDTSIWPWAANVPANSTITSQSFITMTQQGGYGWIW